MLYALHTASITFREIDQLLGTTEHNRPLYVTGTSDGAKVNRILLDSPCGFSVNLMTLRTLRSQAIDVQHLAPENNKRLKSAQSTSSWINYLAPEAGQSPVRGEVLYHQCRHVLQYKALLGKPWLHNYYVVPSTIHQCMKYM